MHVSTEMRSLHSLHGDCPPHDAHYTRKTLRTGASCRNRGFQPQLHQPQGLTGEVVPEGGLFEPPAENDISTPAPPCARIHAPQQVHSRMTAMEHISPETSATMRCAGGLKVFVYFSEHTREHRRQPVRLLLDPEPRHPPPPASEHLQDLFLEPLHDGQAVLPPEVEKDSEEPHPLLEGHHRHGQSARLLWI